MKTIFILALSVLLYSSCAVTSINVINRKATARPATKVLVVYLDEGCDLSLFDSNLYNICLRSCFRNLTTVNQRSAVERTIAANLTTHGTSVIKACDLFDTVNNSYAYFSRCVDSLGIDGLLVSGLRSYSHPEHTVIGAHGDTYRYNTTDAAFVCYLFDTKAITRPIWTAEVGGKGRSYGSENGLNRSMAQKVATGLKASNYITH